MQTQTYYIDYRRNNRPYNKAVKAESWEAAEQIAAQMGGTVFGRGVKREAGV